MIRIFFILLFFPLISFSQVNVKGTTKSKTENVFFANIIFKNTNNTIFTTASNQNAEFTITLNPGVYQIKSSYIGYFDFVKEIKITSDTTLNILFEEETKQLSEVVVRAAPQKITEASVVRTVRNSSVVSDGLSIEFIKKTPDRNVGDALKRVNGVTIQNDKFVLVRGLSDRYNSAILNKTLLPSTEPDRRAFSFDIIPTALIDNIIVSKSSSANQPGDWSGGLVQITTKEVSDNFFNLSLGSGFG